ncbi:DUF4327 family protein [Romeria aff. gracilis LEGE 07310]|uniref:DUF4327 family protein n=1 Tax=Vasconcelosia minhoensis LEGE 07310 TaxID=915328 RepID=A0A8J7DAG4_9CYAN|nr:DUF4327 family protein [Romeria gracilis]MBE9076432.1 DUF4327 family protein [Romeria aff. gracilis LEGE 07310]
MQAKLYRTYTLNRLRQDARSLVAQGKIDRQQPIYVLCQFISGRDWECAEQQLAQNDYQTRDRIGDLLS